MKCTEKKESKTEEKAKEGRKIFATFNFFHYLFDNLTAKNIQTVRCNNLAAPIFFSHLQKIVQNLCSHFHLDQVLAQYVKVTVQNNST